MQVIQMMRLGLFGAILTAKFIWYTMDQRPSLFYLSLLVISV